MMIDMNNHISTLQQIFPGLTLREAGVAYACIEQLAEHIANETALMQAHYADAEIALQVLLRSA